MNFKQKRRLNHLHKTNKRMPICPECGMSGKHYVSSTSDTLTGDFFQSYLNGFLTCDKFYDKETGMRIGVVSSEHQSVVSEIIALMKFIRV